MTRRRAPAAASRAGAVHRHAPSPRRAALDEQLAEVRLRGFATCRGEYEASAWGVSAPVVDSAGRLLAVLSIWGPGTRVTDARFDVLGPLVHAAAGMLLTDESQALKESGSS